MSTYSDFEQRELDIRSGEELDRASRRLPFLVALYEPDGTLSMAVDRRYAIEMCERQPGWYWKEIADTSPCSTEE